MSTQYTILSEEEEEKKSSSVYVSVLAMDLVLLSYFTRVLLSLKTKKKRKKETTKRNRLPLNWIGKLGHCNSLWYSYLSMYGYVLAEYAVYRKRLEIFRRKIRNVIFFYELYANAKKKANHIYNA